jgi:hypothetical protein
MWSSVPVGSSINDEQLGQHTGKTTAEAADHLGFQKITFRSMHVWFTLKINQNNEGHPTACF